MKSKRLFLFQFLCVLYVQSSTAQANGVGNGGDQIATEFRAGALSVYEILSSALESKKLLTKQQLGRLKVAIEETRIDVTNQILVEAEGLTVDARVIRDPMYPNKKMIQLYRPTWSDYLENITKSYRLIFHEYLWVIGVDDHQNRISAKLKIPAPLSARDKPIERFPDGIYTGKGIYKSHFEEPVSYKVRLTIESNVLSEIAYTPEKDFFPPHLRLVYRFQENGFFDVEEAGHHEPMGQGFCNNFQCMVVIEAPQLIMETMSFKNGVIHRQGYVFEDNIQYTWDEQMLPIEPESSSITEVTSSVEKKSSVAQPNKITGLSDKN